MAVAMENSGNAGREMGKTTIGSIPVVPKKSPAEIISSSSGNGLTENSSTLYRSGAILNFRTNMVDSNLIPCLCETLETNFIRH